MAAKLTYDVIINLINNVYVCINLTLASAMLVWIALMLLDLQATGTLTPPPAIRGNSKKDKAEWGLSLVHICEIEVRISTSIIHLNNKGKDKGISNVRWNGRSTHLFLCCLISLCLYLILFHKSEPCSVTGTDLISIFLRNFLKHMLQVPHICELSFLKI